ncbi:MAG: hypothetical protein KF841_11200 [Phycisphaerae bacterium]|nr:hypothetical protein [Phycisphaerae bacterium]
MLLRNSTRLNSLRLERMFRDAIAGWPHDGAQVFVRYSRGSDFSGACYYESDRIFINLGRHVSYPYKLRINVARPQSNRTHWWRELYALEIRSPEELALFIFLHEFYHRLVKRAGRNIRQKEARCDRFATRVLVDHYGCVIRDTAGRLVNRSEWDFQDLNGFVEAARGSVRKSARKPLGRPRRKGVGRPGEVGGAGSAGSGAAVKSILSTLQGMLFEV